MIGLSAYKSTPYETHKHPHYGLRPPHFAIGIAACNELAVVLYRTRGLVL